MRQLAKRNAARAEKVHELLRYLYPSFNEELSNYPNVEDFLNLIEMAKEFHTEAYIESKRWSRSNLQEVMDATLRAITEYIWVFMAEEGGRGALSSFARELVRPADVVISFNWDFLIDLVLEDTTRNGPVYSYSSSSDSVVLLKPHGSIDWFEKDELPLSDKALLKEMRYRARGVYYYPYFRIAQNPDLVNRPCFILPPVSSKKFRGFLQCVWRDVYRAVAGANELYIIGYSLPREDQFARLVIGRAIERNISRRKKRRRLRVIVVNPDENAMGTFANLVGSGVGFTGHRSRTMCHGCGRKKSNESLTRSFEHGLGGTPPWIRRSILSISTKR